MNFKRIKLHILYLSVGLLFGVCITASAQDVGLTVIGNPESVPETMNKDQLQSVLKGEKLRWDNGVAVKIALMKTSTEIGFHTSKKIYNMSANELNKYFLAQVFQGKIKAPTFFTSISELESFVASTPGAIGISQVTSNREIKVVIVDGKKQL